MRLDPRYNRLSYKFKLWNKILNLFCSVFLWFSFYSLLRLFVSEEWIFGTLGSFMFISLLFSIFYYDKMNKRKGELDKHNDTRF